MTSQEQFEAQVDSAIAHAESALASRVVSDLSYAMLLCEGALDLAAKRCGAEELVRSVYAMVRDELRVQRS